MGQGKGFNNMALDFTQLSAYSDLLNITALRKLKLTDWDAKIKHRAIHNRQYKDLTDLKAFYPEKIKKIQDLRQQYVDYKKAATPEERAECIAQFDEKLKRLADKYACTLKEIDIRDTKTLIREVV